MTFLEPVVAPSPATLAASSMLGDWDADVGWLHGMALHYQPIVNTAGTPVALEALLRVQRSGQGIPPLAVIQHARTRGQLPQLGRLVQHTGLTEFAACSGPDMPYRLALNTAAEEFEVDGFAQQLLGRVDRAGLHPEQLTLEVTEDRPLSQSLRARHNVTALQSAGVRLSMDDFGAGSNGFKTLMQTRFQQIKLDRCFVEHLADRRVLVAGMIQMARQEGVEVVCEGIETAEQHRMLSELGCQLFQGYFFGRPATLGGLGFLKG